MKFTAAGHTVNKTNDLNASHTPCLICDLKWSCYTGIMQCTGNNFSRQITWLHSKWMDHSRGLESQEVAENTRACTALLDWAPGHFSHVAQLHQLPSSLCHQLPASTRANVPKLWRQCPDWHIFQYSIDTIYIDTIHCTNALTKLTSMHDQHYCIRWIHLRMHQQPVNIVRFLFLKYAEILLHH